MSVPGPLLSLLEEVAGRPLGDPPDDTPLAEGLGLDSIAFLELVVGLEERFGIAVRVEDVEAAFRTVGSLRALIAARSRSRA